MKIRHVIGVFRGAWRAREIELAWYPNRAGSHSADLQRDQASPRIVFLTNAVSFLCDNPAELI